MCVCVCRSIGVNVYSKYKGDPVGQATGIAELLAKHGLRLKSTHSDVMVSVMIHFWGVSRLAGNIL